MKNILLILVTIAIGLSNTHAQWTTVDIDNSSETTLFKHTGSSTPVPFNLQKTGYNGSSVNYGILHLDMGHGNVGGGANLHYRLKNSIGDYKEYGGFGSYIINNASGNEDGGLAFYTTDNGQSRIRRMTVLNNGNVGIGTTNPAHKLDINTGGGNFKTYTYGVEQTVNTSGGWARAFRLRNEYNNATAVFGSMHGSAYISTGFDIQSDATGYQNQKFTVGTNGNIGIGTTTPSEKLSVNGTIRTKEVKVEAAPWPDYVFHEDYELKSLSEVSTYIEKNHHLPGIPTAEEVAENGIKLGEMNAKLLEKVEELTLYLIEMKEENITQNSLIDTQNQTVERLLNRVEELEKKLED